MTSDTESEAPPESRATSHFRSTLLFFYPSAGVHPMVLDLRPESEEARGRCGCCFGLIAYLTTRRDCQYWMTYTPTQWLKALRRNFKALHELRLRRR